MRRALEILARLVAATIWMVSALYGVIAYVPFTYTQVIETRLSEPLLAFAAWHPAFAWLAAGATAFALARRLRAGERDAWALVVTVAATALLLTAWPVLAVMRNEPRSLWLGWSMLIPVVWLAWLDVRSMRRKVRWLVPSDPADTDGRLLLACGLAAVFVWGAFAAVAWTRVGPAIAVEQATWSLPAHLLLYAATFVTLTLASGLALGARKAPAVEFWLCVLMAWGLIATLLVRVVLGPIAFAGAQAVITAVALSAAIVALWASVALVIRGASPLRVARGLEVLLMPSGRRRSWPVAAVALLGLGVGAAVAVNRAAIMDWNFLLQKVTAAIVWVLALAWIYSALAPRRLSRPLAGVAAACLAPIAFVAIVLTGDRAAADRVAAYDPSFRLASDFAMPTPEAPDEGGLYQALLANTNIARERKVEAIDVQLAPALGRSAAALPHVFIIVIDSLRRDYVAPFNPAVTFTPRLAQFANDGVAFMNAFTRYGATGLSEPSIWVGGMLLHKQYVTPFAPQNSLQKLLVAEGYRQFVSVDSILRVLFPPDVPGLTELDQGRHTKDYDLCLSLPELQSKLAGVAGGGDRLFAYTQPQNLHISTITRDGATPPDTGAFPGFYGPYAARLQKVDECFGHFIDYLKAAGLYDNSIVVFTADHGDSLGEEGRWGHAYTVFPEVMRIPLIIKLPGDGAARLAPNREALVFSTDITPTLFEALGHPLGLTTFPFGRSLLTGSGTPPLRRTGPELVASSYGAVYGALTGGGQRLYIVDAVNFQDYVYDLTSGLVGRRTTIGAADRESRQVIRDGVATIAKVYRFGSN